MNSGWRTVLAFGSVVLLTGALLHILTDGGADSSSPSDPEVEKQPSEDSRLARKSLEPAKDTPVARPHPSEPEGAAPLSPDGAPPAQFVEPESEELFWEELERLEREDKQKALAYALAGEDWYGEEGRPAEGRRAKIVTLLVDVGKMDEARARTRVFIEKYPNSSYRRLVQGVTGIHPRPGAPPRSPD